MRGGIPGSDGKAGEGEREDKQFGEGATHKVQEAAADLMVSVGLGLEQVVHHGQEVSVDGQDLFNVGEQNLSHKQDTNTSVIIRPATPFTHLIQTSICPQSSPNNPPQAWMAVFQTAGHAVNIPQICIYLQK